MSIVIACAVVFGAGMAWHIQDEWAFPPLLMTILGGVGLIATLGSIPITRADMRAQLAGLEAIRATAAQAREADDGLEGAAFRVKVAEQNALLAKAQYWNGTVFDIWFPEEVMSAQPIEVAR